ITSIPPSTSSPSRRERRSTGRPTLATDPLRRTGKLLPIGITGMPSSGSKGPLPGRGSRRSWADWPGVHPPNREEEDSGPVSYTHLRAHETKANLVCRLLLEKKKNRKEKKKQNNHKKNKKSNKTINKIHT